MTNAADDHAARSALKALRSARQRKRLVQLEWFELAYKVYVAAIIAIAAVVLVANLIGDDPFTPDQLVHLRTYAPSVVGVVMAVLVGLGLRSGARGGPISVESAEVLHVLMAPVSRRAVLLRPGVQQVRLAAFAGLSAGAIAGLLTGRRVGDDLSPWILCAALVGGTLAVSFVAAGMLAHVVRLPRWAATAMVFGLAGWQAASVPTRWNVPGPFDTVGSLAIWPMRVHAVDLVTPALVIAAAVLGLAALGRFSVDALARRSALVTQLRFAVTMRDLRTVVLLRRQLSNEQHRTKPWFAWPGPDLPVVAARGVHSVTRFPLSRLWRMLLLTALAAAAQVAAYRGTTPAIVVSGLATFVLGLECLEAFAQEVDQPDRCDAVPHVRGWLLARHLVVPAILSAFLGVLGAVGVVIATGGNTVAWQLALVVTLPVVWGGLGGAVLNIMSGIPAPETPGSVNELLPPEVAGMREIFRTVRPLVVAIAGSLPIAVARAAAKTGAQPVPPALQATVAVGILLAVVAWWARRRDEFTSKFRGLWAAGDAEFQARHRARPGGTP